MNIAQASISELGTIDGENGNQTGKELNIAKLKAGKWNKIIRPKNKTLAEYISKIAQAGVANKHIGYSKYKRNSLWREAKRFKSLGGITIKCACDCSSFVSVVANLAYYALSMKWLPNYNIDINACTTTNLAKKLELTGEFEVLDFKLKDCKRGDIVIAEGKHTAIVI